MRKLLIGAAIAGAMAMAGSAMAANQEGGDDPRIDSAFINNDDIRRNADCGVILLNELDDANVRIQFRRANVKLVVAGKSGNVNASCSVKDRRVVEFLIDRFNNGSAEPVSIERCTISNLFKRGDRDENFRIRGTGHATLSPSGNFTLHCSGQLPEAP